MNDEVKEILIDLINYYNIIGTEDDPEFEQFAGIGQRALKALERDVAERCGIENLRSSDVDPFTIDVIRNRKLQSADYEPPPMKFEDEF